MTTRPAPPVTFDFFRDEAIRYYLKYYNTQQWVLKMEAGVEATVKGINAQRYTLEQDPDYSAACGARNAYLAAAQLNATMAMLVKGG
jgi:hypothetical protein